jgi:hypothetical protein
VAVNARIPRLCYLLIVNATPERCHELSNDQKWAILMMKTQEKRCSEAVTLFRAHGIEPVLIKGMAAAAFYPANRPRLSVDIDLAVSSGEFRAAEHIGASAAAAGLAIDVHSELRHMDTVPWEDLLSKSRTLTLAGTEIRVLRPEDHLRVLCVHWLTDGGIDVERLYDIYFHITNRPDDFDWTRFADIVGPNRRRWLDCALGMAERDLGLDLSATPFAGAAGRLPKWLVNCIDAARKRGRDLPMEAAITDKRAVLEQVKRRLRPNPIYATIQLEGNFDAPTRVPYQIYNFFSRIPSSVRRVVSNLGGRE